MKQHDLPFPIPPKPVAIFFAARQAALERFDKAAEGSKPQAKMYASDACYKEIRDARKLLVPVIFQAAEVAGKFISAGEAWKIAHLI